MSDVSSTTSGLSGAGGGNTLRITGMATGLDVDAMVKKMMAAEQLKVDKVKQDRQVVAWKQEAYQDIIKDLKDLQSSYYDASSSDKNILSSASFSAFDVAVTSGTGAIATASSGAQAGVYTVNVAALAKGAGVTKDLSSNSPSILLSSKLSDISGSNLDSGNISLVLNTGGSDMTINLDNTGGKATVSDLLNAINNGTGGTVKASYSELSKKLSIYSSATGTSAKLTINSATSNASLSNFVGTISPGTNADFTLKVPGDTTEYHLTDKTSNNFSIDGVNYSLSASGTTSFTVTQNTQKVYDKIKGFIDKYNAVVDKIQTKITEKKNYDYKPLTDTQKTSMKDSDITAWETKAKQGLLRNDDNLSKLLSDLKSSFSTAVNDAGLSFGQYGSNTIGLDFSTSYDKPAHVDIIDDSKLKSAIAQNGSQILKMFTNVSQTSLSGSYDPSKTTYQEDGIFVRVKKAIEKNVGLTNVNLNSSILTKYANYQDDYTSSGYGGTNTLPDQLYQKDVQLKSLQSLLSTKQESYYMKFSKLETAMNQLNSQQSSLTSMLG